MALHIRDPEADRLLRDFAAKRKLSLTNALKAAVRDADTERASAARDDAMADDGFEARLSRLQDRMSALGTSGLKADKAFYDSLNDE